MEIKKGDFVEVVISKTIRSMRISREEFMSKKRIRQFAYAKHFACKALKDISPRYGQYISLNEIGTITGGRDHASAIHSIKTANNLIDTDKEYRKYYNDLTASIEYEIKKIQLSNHLGLPYRDRNVQLHLANKIAREFSFRRTARMAREQHRMVQSILSRPVKSHEQVPFICTESRKHSSGQTSGTYMDRSRQFGR